MQALKVYGVVLVGAVLVAAAEAPTIGRTVTAAATPPAAFARCAGCHANVADEPAEIGPNLFGVVGSQAGSRPGFTYSAALKKSGVVWTKTSLARFIGDPASVAPGTTMPNPGVSASERDALATYLTALK